MVEESRLTQLAGIHTAQVATTLVASGSVEEFAVWKNNTGKKITITAVGFVPDADIAGRATNFMSLGFQNKGLLGAGTIAISIVKDYDSDPDDDVDDFTEAPLVLSTTLANRDIDINEVVTMKMTKTANGAVLPAGVATLSYRFKG